MPILPSNMGVAEAQGSYWGIHLIWWVISPKCKKHFRFAPWGAFGTLGCTSMDIPQILLKITPLIAVTCHFSRPLLCICDHWSVTREGNPQVLCFPYTPFFISFYFEIKCNQLLCFSFPVRQYIYIYIVKFYLFIYLSGYIVKEQNWESPSNRPSDGWDSHFICIKFTHAPFSS